MSEVTLPTVSVLVLTYNRKDILLATIRLLKEHLYYPGTVRYVVSDDGSDDGTQDALKNEFPDLALVQNQRVGLGAIANRGLERCWADGDFVLQLQDDMQLQRALDLMPHVHRLTEDTTSGFIRLWGVSGHKYWGALEGMYWRIWQNSPELYIPSDRPHLKHGRFHAYYGYYPEGRKTGDTEEAWCHQVKDLSGQKGGSMDVLVPHSLDVETLWVHAGWHTRWRDKGL